jgi:stage III sporulation protein AE
MHEIELNKILEEIVPADEQAAALCRKRWDGIAKPLHSLGWLEDTVARIAAAQHSAAVHTEKKILIPMVYFFLVLSVVNNAIGEEIMKKLRDNMKWIITWLLKTILYIYTGYIGITGVISGTTDATALKVAKLAISGLVPVVGKILSDASETVLISAGAVKNATGIYGLFAILAIWIGPFLQIAIHYLLLKAAGAVCSVISSKPAAELIQDFSSALGLLLAMTGTICLLLLISLVCYLKGVG